MIVMVCLIYASIYFATSFSFGESVDVTSDEEVVSLILDHQEYCIEMVTADKIYLKPQKLFPSKEGVFLSVDQFVLVKIPRLFSDQDGCYIRLP